MCPAVGRHVDEPDELAVRPRRDPGQAALQPVIKTVIMSAPTSIFSGSDVGDHWRLKASPLRSIAGIWPRRPRPTRQPWVEPDSRGRSIGLGIA